MNNPNDREWLQLAAEAVQSKIPDNHGFILFVAPYGPDGTLRYTATMRRDDAINVLKEFLIKAGAGEDWLNHIK